MSASDSGDWVKVDLWLEDVTERCPANSTVWDCDLLSGHEGPHIYVHDHDRDGSVCSLIVWPVTDKNGSTTP